MKEVIHSKLWQTFQVFQFDMVSVGARKALRAKVNDVVSNSLAVIRSRFLCQSSRCFVKIFLGGYAPRPPNAYHAAGLDNALDCNH